MIRLVGQKPNKTNSCGTGCGNGVSSVSGDISRGSSSSFQQVVSHLKSHIP